MATSSAESFAGPARSEPSLESSKINADSSKTSSKLDCVSKACSGVVDAFKKMKLELKSQGKQLPTSSLPSSSSSVSSSSQAASDAGSASGSSSSSGSSTGGFESTPSSIPRASSSAVSSAGDPVPPKDAATPQDTEESVFPPDPSDQYYGYGPHADRYSAEMSVFFGSDEWKAMQSSTPTSNDSEASTSRPSATYAYAACPPATPELGRATWTFLHSTAAYYPSQPSVEEQQLMQTTLRGLGAFYPCHVCAEHLRGVMEEEPPRVSSNLALSLWMCRTHNKVNEGLNKPFFDCRKAIERWRDGPSDGSCD